MLSVIGAETIEAAANVSRLSDERASFEAKRDEAEAELRQAGDGLSDRRIDGRNRAAPPDEDVARIASRHALHISKPTTPRNARSKTPAGSGKTWNKSRGRNQRERRRRRSAGGDRIAVPDTG